jgi:hypothetical protein
LAANFGSKDSANRAKYKEKMDFFLLFPRCSLSLDSFGRQTIARFSFKEKYPPRHPLGCFGELLSANLLTLGIAQASLVMSGTGS